MKTCLQNNLFARRMEPITKNIARYTGQR